jgi:hypothetical protein
MWMDSVVSRHKFGAYLPKATAPESPDVSEIAMVAPDP